MYHSMDIYFSLEEWNFGEKSFYFEVLVSQRKVPQVLFRNGLMNLPIVSCLKKWYKSHRHQGVLYNVMVMW